MSAVVVEQSAIVPQQKDAAKEEKIDVESLLHNDHQALKKDVDFLQSLVSLGTLKEASRRPVTSGVVLLIYGLFSVMLVVGMISLKTCSTHGIIPIYLIVAGLMGIAIKILLDTTNRCLFNTLVAMMVLYLIWHIVCSYFIFKAYHPNYDPEEGPYCSRLAYLVAFWSLMVQYTIFGVFILLSVCRCLMRGDTKT
ncbi:hypothetical protein AMK59_87 [Oryctes borbonicus]|uniref:MARVEL domain-containing protein n=1 Tax=Oryctes borbonicus TaxID=1629725 RepID=A0A0T6BDF7_9SCAR|nr:hypothetical protein AMK59_87 [Oryctes borbonicus]